MADDALKTPQVQEGIRLAHLATEADASGNNAKAIGLYKEACTLFMESYKSL